MSFTDVLSNEINAVAPPPPPPPPAAVNSAASASSGSNSTGNNSGTSSTGNASGAPAPGSPASGTSATGTTAGGTGSTSGSGSVGKKSTHPTQTDAQASSAAAATAAALASVASGAAASNKPSDPTTTADGSPTDGASSTTQNVTTKIAATSTPVTDQIASLAGTVAATAASGQAHEFNSKVPLTNAQGNIAGSATSKTNAPIAAQTATAVTPVQSPQGKNDAQQPSEFEATLNRAGNQDNAPAIKTAITETVTEANPTSSAATPSTSTAASLTTNLANANDSMQTLQSANQNLSVSQMSAIAPVLSMPVSNQAISTPAETIAPQVGSSAWDEAIGQKVNWMVGAGQQSASLTLNPPGLGPLQVVVSLNNQHANATFTSHQPEVRAALENAIPKLREILGQSGIQLGDCNVNSQTKQEFTQSQSNSNSGSNPGAGAASTVSAISSISNSGHRVGVGLVDTFV
jgi:flagellar hook-length control protein FliK